MEFVSLLPHSKAELLEEYQCLQITPHDPPVEQLRKHMCQKDFLKQFRSNKEADAVYKKVEDTIPKKSADLDPKNFMHVWSKFQKSNHSPRRGPRTTRRVFVFRNSTCGLHPPSHRLGGGQARHRFRSSHRKLVE